MTIPLAFIAALSIGSLWVQRRQHRDPGACRPHFILGLLPTALLFMTLPLAISAFHTIRGFQQIAAEGRGGLDDVAVFCRELSNALSRGGLGLLLAMGAAGALALGASVNDDEPDDSTNTSASRTWLLAGSSALLLPVAWGAFAGEQTIGLVIRGAAIRDSQQLAALSQTISEHLVMTVLGGVVLSGALVMIAVVNLWIARRARTSAWLIPYSWAVFGAVVLVGVWSILKAAADFHAIDVAVRSS